MRETKFRGALLGNVNSEEIWTYGYLVGNNENSLNFKNKYITPSAIYEAKEVNPGTVGQFIGRHDKNGKEIYEQDVVDVVDTYAEEGCEIAHFVGVIEYNNGSFCVRKDASYTTYRLMDLELTVIGNLYETPFY